MRVALALEYDGAAYCGWERQRHSPTLQERLESALSIVADRAVRTVCAGRTDAGVHALGQVVHFDTHARRSDHAWLMGCNANLPADMNALWVHRPGEDFHARFRARQRHYGYLIDNNPVRSALHRHRAAWQHRPLSVEPMQAAAGYLLGEHDFSAYRSSACQAPNPVRRINRLEVHRYQRFILIRVSANAFLHHMVRNIVGVLVRIGVGERPPHWAQQVLDSKDRRTGGVTAKAHGLRLLGVDYPPEFGLPVKDPVWPILW